MARIPVHALFAFTAMAIICSSMPTGAQSPSAASYADAFSVHISMSKNSYAIGEKPIAIMSFTSTNSDPIWFPNDRDRGRVHILSKDGEPPKTELYRHAFGDFRPGDRPELMPGPGPVVGIFIRPNSYDSQGYDLTRYYDLSKPGNYSVYLELDLSSPSDKSSHWLRSNTVHFVIEAPAQ